MTCHLWRTPLLGSCKMQLSGLTHCRRVRGEAEGWLEQQQGRGRGAPPWASGPLGLWTSAPTARHQDTAPTASVLSGEEGRWKKTEQHTGFKGGGRTGASSGLEFARTTGRRASLFVDGQTCEPFCRRVDSLDWTQGMSSCQVPTALARLGCMARMVLATKLQLEEAVVRRGATPPGAGRHF